MMSVSGLAPPEKIRALSTPELALALLSSLARTPDQVNCNNMFRGAEPAFRRNGEPDVNLETWTSALREISHLG
jgi:hypothetical protein